MPSERLSKKMQLANQAQSMGLTDLASRLRVQANTAKQVAQGYLTQFVLSAPAVQQFMASYNQLVSLLNNQPNPQTDPQGWVQWYREVVSTAQQAYNAYDQAKIYLAQGKDLPQIQQLIEAGQGLGQFMQQLGASPILNVSPNALTQPGGLGATFMGGALLQSTSQLPPGTQITQTQATPQLNPVERAGVEFSQWLARYGNVNPLAIALPGFSLIDYLLPQRQRQVLQTLARATNRVGRDVWRAR